MEDKKTLGFEQTEKVSGGRKLTEDDKRRIRELDKDLEAGRIDLDVYNQILEDIYAG